MKSLALTALVLGSQLASASVVLLQDNRSVSQVYTVPSPPDVTTPSTPFSNWNTFYQNSQVTSWLMQGSGYGSAYSDMVGDHTFSSAFDVQFEVMEEQTLKLTGTLNTFGRSFCACSTSGFRLSGPTGFSTITSLINNPSPADLGGSRTLTITEEISLAPGQYRIEFWTHNEMADWDTGSNWSFNARFGEVPVPAAGWMLLSALGSLGAARKLRQRKA